MKLILIAALAALSILGAEVPKPKEPAAPSDRTLTETESLKLQLVAAKIQILQDKYKLSEYQKELEPLAAEQRSVAVALCQSIGIPANLIETQCRVNAGNGPDGKSVAARVWREVPPAAPAVGTK